MIKENLLSGVEDTLYIPLVARIYVSQRFPEFFYDEKALSLKKYLKANNIEKNSTEFFHMASVCRQQKIDEKIIGFLEKNQKANVVFLGAGLETAYNRIKNTDANFYQVDLQEVIDIRKKLLGSFANEKLIAGDMFTLKWIEQIDSSLSTIIVVAGVYQYFDKDKIIEMIKKMKKLIYNAELVFDATNSKGLKIANKYVKKTGNINADMNFAIDDPSKFAKLCNASLINVEGFFDKALKICKNLKLITKIYMYFTDKLNRTMIIHLKFN